MSNKVTARQLAKLQRRAAAHSFRKWLVPDEAGTFADLSRIPLSGGIRRPVNYC